MRGRYKAIPKRVWMVGIPVAVLVIALLWLGMKHPEATPQPTSRDVPASTFFPGNQP